MYFLLASALCVGSQNKPIASIDAQFNMPLHGTMYKQRLYGFWGDKEASRFQSLKMKDTIETKSFDPTKLRPVNVEGRAKLLLEYLPLISADAKK